MSSRALPVAKDPPIGRIGYVLDGGGLGRQIADAKTEVRCMGCRTWFDGRYYLCPDCEHPRPGFNKRLRSAHLDNHLLGYAHTASQEASMAPITSNVTY